jgi:hypothetical protein
MTCFLRHFGTEGIASFRQNNYVLMVGSNSSGYSRGRIMESRRVLEKKIHRALVEARCALYGGDREAARAIVRNIVKEAAGEAVRLSLRGEYNWVYKALQPVEQLLLQDNNNEE